MLFKTIGLQLIQCMSVIKWVSHSVPFLFIRTEYAFFKHLTEGTLTFISRDEF